MTTVQLQHDVDVDFDAVMDGIVVGKADLQQHQQQQQQQVLLSKQSEDEQQDQEESITEEENQKRKHESLYSSKTIHTRDEVDSSSSSSLARSDTATTGKSSSWSSSSLSSSSLRDDIVNEIRAWIVDEQSFDSSSSSGDNHNKNKIEHDENNNSNTTTNTIGDIRVVVQQQQQQQQQNSLRGRSALPSPPKTLGAFIHLGKTGGSTWSRLLRNGCHSYKKKPCNNHGSKKDNNETYISMFTTYYHIPDFKPNIISKYQSHYKFFIVTLRDPYDRTISAFTYMHPQNIISRPNESIRYWIVNKFKTFYIPCFNTLEHFAMALQDSSNDEEEHHQQQGNNNSNSHNNSSSSSRNDGTNSSSTTSSSLLSSSSHCQRLAQASMRNEIPAATHLYYDTKKILTLAPKIMSLWSSKPPSLSSSSSSSDEGSRTGGRRRGAGGRRSGRAHNNKVSSNRTAGSSSSDSGGAVVLVLRDIDMWGDWIRANRWLGQAATKATTNSTTQQQSQQEQESGIAIYPKMNIRNHRWRKLPITRDISNEGRKRLCSALSLEYEAYFNVLINAVNLQPKHIQHSLDIARKNCPNLNLTIPI